MPRHTTRISRGKNPPSTDVAVNIIFGGDDVEPILGMTALESVGIEVDPRNQRLKRLPAVRLKSLRDT